VNRWCFQIGTVAFSSSISAWQAWKASVRCAQDTPTTTARSPTSRSPTRCAGAEESARAAAGSARPGWARAAQAARSARAARAKARVACAASLLRWIYFMTVHGASWDAQQAV
jgi:hypothetical protein